MVAVAVLLVVALVVRRQGSWALGAGWTSDGPGSGYFPFYIGLILCIAGAGILYQALLGKKRDTEIFVDREQLKRVLSVLVPAARLRAGGPASSGIYVASAIYIAAVHDRAGQVLAGQERRSSAWSSACCSSCMFEVWFKVPLFKGTLDPLAFLGY